MNDLSSILDETPRFSFFNELVSIPIAPVLQHDLFKINKLLDDITCYLFQVLRLFEKFKVKRNQFKGNELDWYYEGKDELLDIIRNINSIDGIIGKLLEALDESPHLTPSHALLEKFEQASDLLLDVKKYSILSKKKLNVAINFKDLESVILSLTREIEQCERVIVRLFLEQKLNKNNQVEMADYSLETILSKINASNGEKSSLLLPTFSSLEDEMYETWLLLQTKVVPLKASLDFLPMRIAEFEMIRNNNNVTIATSSQFAGSKSEVDVIYQDLQLKWHSLGDQLDAIKFETITKKWKQVFTFMIDEVSKICSQLILQVKSESSTTSKLFIASYKLCSNSIDVINKAFLEKIISEVSLILAFNEKLLPKWYLLHDTLTKQHVLDQSFHSTPRNTGNRKSVEVSGLRPFSIILKRPLPSPEPEQPLENGYGIDLGIGIQQVEIPFSIKQNGKVRDFFKQSSLNMAPIKSPQRLLQSLNSDDEVETDDDTSTLVTSKRYISIEEKDIYNGLMRLSIQEKWEYLRNNNKRNFGLASRIPIILFNYRQLGYQVIKKKY